MIDKDLYFACELLKRMKNARISGLQINCLDFDKLNSFLTTGSVVVSLVAHEKAKSSTE